MRENPVRDKSYAFALRIVKLYRFLTEERKEYVLSKQLVRSGTSIGANVEEGLAGQSTRDFIAKLQISLKEAKESHYWIRLLRDSELMEDRLADSFLSDCDELISLLTKILKTTKREGGIEN